MGAAVDLEVQVRTRVESLWPGLRPDVEIEYPNSSVKVDMNAKVRGRLTLLSDGEPIQEAAGDGVTGERHFDSIVFEVLAQLGTGRLAQDVADAWASMWTGNPIAGYRFGITQRITVGRVGSGDDARWKVDAITRVERTYQP